MCRSGTFPDCECGATITCQFELMCRTCYDQCFEEED